MELSGIKLLLFNPWINDFTAFNFRIKPASLLQLTAILMQYDLQITLLDCLDRVRSSFPVFSEYPHVTLKMAMAPAF